VRKSQKIVVMACFCGALALPFAAQAIWMEQTIPLRAGWNAVHMKVNPAEYGCDRVFGGGGIDQVTWWNRSRRDDGTGSVTADTFAWYASGVEPNTFGAVLGDERYLVHAVAATNLVVRGTPALPRGELLLGDLNLVGLNMVNGQATCNDYFQYLAEKESSPYWSVTAANEHMPIRPRDVVANASEAIWLDTTGEGKKTYMGPFELSLDTGDKIVAWTSSTAARTITVKNVTDTDRVLRFGFERSIDPPAGQGALAGDVKIKVESIDWSQGYARRVYSPVGATFVTNVAAGAAFTFKVRPDLAAMPATSSGDYLSILTVSDAGSRINGSVRANGTCFYRVGLKADGQLAASKSPAGLWVGSVALTGVNRAQMLTSAKSEWDAEKIQDTTQAFQFRLLLHAGDDGAVKLMKQAFVGSTEGDNALAAVIADKETAKAYRKKYPSAKIRRVSSANFPFMDPKAFDGAANFLKDGGELTVSFTQAYDAKDNPFMHAFHPNHDNLAFNNGAPSKKEDGATGTGDYESWNVTRAVKLTFAGTDPTGAADEDWNRTVCGGTYRETITGLNKTPIIVEGAFRLYKSLDTPEIQTGGVAR